MPLQTAQTLGSACLTTSESTSHLGHQGCWFSLIMTALLWLQTQKVVLGTTKHSQAMPPKCGVDRGWHTLCGVDRGWHTFHGGWHTFHGCGGVVQPVSALLSAPLSSSSSHSS